MYITIKSVMARRSITVYYSDNDPDLKGILKNLSDCGDPDTNRYYGRKESEIVRMILIEKLPKEHRKICGDSVE